MKRTLSIVIVALGLTGVSFAQSSDYPLAELALSRLKTRFTLGGSLTGLGSGAALAGQSVAWYENDASCLSWNPAGLGQMKKRSVIVDFAPGLLQDPTKFYDVDDKIAQEMDKIIDDHGQPGYIPGYPTLDARGGLSGDLVGFGLAVPFQIAGISMGAGFGYSSPFRLNLDMAGTEFSALIDSEEEIEDQIRRIRMRTNAAFSGELDVRVHHFQFGLGASLTDRFSMGITVNRYRFSAAAHAKFNIDGIIEMSGVEYAFNDPDDPNIDFAQGETNSLAHSLSADFVGSGWGFKLGLMHQISPALQIGFTADLPPVIKTSGRFHTLRHEIPFLVLEDTDDVDDMIDPSKIDLAQLTKTERIEKNESYDLNIELPKAYSVGLVAGKGTFHFVLRLTSYSGGFAYDLVGEERRGLKFKYGGGLAFDFKYVFLGLSGAICEEIWPLDDEDSEPLLDMATVPFGKVNFGFRIPFTSRIRTDGIVGLEPTPHLRLSFRYLF